MFIRLVSVHLLGLVLVSLVSAQIALAESRAEPLLLSDVLAEARAHHPEIQAARERYKAAKERPAQAGALDDPEAKIELWNTPENLDITKTSNTIFGLSQRFPFPGKRGLKKQLALKEADIAEEQVREKELEISAQAKGAYYELYLAYKTIEIHHQQIELLKNFFQIANARFRAGKGVQVDVIKASLELSKLQNELPVLEQQRASAQGKVNLVMNHSPETLLGMPAEPATRVDKLAFLELREVAIQNRPQLKALTTDTARSETAIALAQKQSYPDFNVMASRFQNFGQRDGFGGAVVMSVPFSFWTKPKYDAGVREARANLEAAKASYQAVQNQVGFEVKDLLVKLEAADKLMVMYRTTIIPQAQQTLDSARLNYQNGKVEFLTLLDAERALKDFQLEFYRALTAFAQRMAELERAIGKELT
jgi:outer membrane protein TolC